MTATQLGTAMHGKVDVSYMDRLMQARVDESVLVDAIEAYASQQYVDDEARDDFLTQMSEPPYGPLVRKAVLDVVFAVIAASELPTDDAFKALIELLNVGEEDDIIRAVKRTFLTSMIDNDNDYEGGAVSEQQVLNRLRYVEGRIGTG